MDILFVYGNAFCVRAAFSCTDLFLLCMDRLWCVARNFVDRLILLALMFSFSYGPPYCVLTSMSCVYGLSFGMSLSDVCVPVSFYVLGHFVFVWVIFLCMDIGLVCGHHFCVWISLLFVGILFVYRHPLAASLVSCANPFFSTAIRLGMTRLFMYGFFFLYSI